MRYVIWQSLFFGFIGRMKYFDQRLAWIVVVGVTWEQPFSFAPDRVWHMSAQNNQCWHLDRTNTFICQCSCHGWREGTRKRRIAGDLYNSWTGENQHLFKTHTDAQTLIDTHTKHQIHTQRHTHEKHRRTTQKHWLSSSITHSECRAPWFHLRWK